MEQTQDIYSYILTEEANFKKVRVPITNSKDWNMHEHIERCTNVANAWFHTGQNDGLRPYKDIVTPIINVAFRSEGFDVKDIVPFVDDADNFYKSFLVKKYHPQWARKNELDTFIDNLVETSIIYDLALVKNIKNVRPEVVKLQTIAFCDQTDILTAPICLKHQFTPSELLENSGKWDAARVQEALTMASAEKTVSNANDKSVKTPGKYIEVYELRGTLPDGWLSASDYESQDGKYTNQLHFVCYYTGNDGKKNGITLFKGKTRKLTDTFKALKIDQIRSHGRACGKSIVESLFEPQVWINYDEIKIKAMLDAAAINLLQTDSEDFGGQRIDDLKNNTIIKHEAGKPITPLNSEPRNMVPFTEKTKEWQDNARLLGSASEGALGENPTAGTPFALQQLIVQEGQGMHAYRQGKIATFVADVLYRDWILQYLVNEMNGGKTFSEELTLDEMQEISDAIARKRVKDKEVEVIFSGGVVTQESRDAAMQFEKEKFMKGGKRGFFKALENELNDIPVSVMVNIKGKQKNMAQNADKLTNIIRTIMANPAAIQQIPGLGKTFNELLEDSGMSAVDFTQITTASKQVAAPTIPTESTAFKIAA